jgi:hypothetical protein
LGGFIESRSHHDSSGLCDAAGNVGLAGLILPRRQSEAEEMIVRDWAGARRHLHSPGFASLQSVPVI